MTSWYRTGTVAVENNSTTVTGSLTAWLMAAKAGDAFVGPDAARYEITAVTSNTEIEILPAYAGSTASGQPYAIERISTAWNSVSELSVTIAETAEAFQRGFAMKSTSSVAIGSGTKEFVAPSGLPILPGAQLKASSATPGEEASHWISGTVTEYTGQTLKLLAEQWGGSGTRTSWNINISGQRGPVGGAVSVPGSTTVDNVVGWNANNGSALKDLGSFPSLLAIHAREKLTANRTYYVSPSGNNNNNGLTVGTPFQTLARAVSVAHALDASIYDVTIQLADGEYTGAGVPLNRSLFGGGTLSILGNVNNPSLVVLKHAISLTQAGNVVIRGVKFQDVGAASAAVSVGMGSHARIGNIDFGVMPANCDHINILVNGMLAADWDYTISGSAARHLEITTGGTMTNTNRTLTVLNNPAWALEFCYCAGGANATFWGYTVNGSATGRRYQVNTNGIIQVYGGGPNLFPGDVAGITATGGIYA